MKPLEDSHWPPTTLVGERVSLRASRASDRPAFIELFSSPEVGAFTGGPQSREQLEAHMPEVPGSRPGFFTVEHNEAGATIGMVTIDRCDPPHDLSVPFDAGEANLGYLFLPEYWGQGLATEACTLALQWFAATHPGEDLLAITQVANHGSLRLAEKLGFQETARFEQYDAPQWLGRLNAPSATRYTRETWSTT